MLELYVQGSAIWSSWAEKFSQEVLILGQNSGTYVYSSEMLLYNI